MPDDKPKSKGLPPSPLMIGSGLMSSMLNRFLPEPDAPDTVPSKQKLPSAPMSTPGTIYMRGQTTGQIIRIPMDRIGEATQQNYLPATGGEVTDFIGKHGDILDLSGTPKPPTDSRITHQVEQRFRPAKAAAEGITESLTGESIRTKPANAMTGLATLGTSLMLPPGMGIPARAAITTAAGIPAYLAGHALTNRDEPGSKTLSGENVTEAGLQSLKYGAIPEIAGGILGKGIEHGLPFFKIPGLTGILDRTPRTIEEWAHYYHKMPSDVRGKVIREALGEDAAKTLERHVQEQNFKAFSTLDPHVMAAQGGAHFESEWAKSPLLGKLSGAWQILDPLTGSHLTVPPTSTAAEIAEHLRQSRISFIGNQLPSGEVMTKAMAEAKPAPISMTPAKLGELIQKYITETGAPIFKAEASRQIAELSMATQNLQVDYAPLKVEAGRMLSEIRNRAVVLPVNAATKPQVLKSMMPPKAVAELLTDILKLPDKEPFMLAFERRKRWYTSSKEPSQLIGKEPASIYSKFVKHLTEEMDKTVNSAPTHPLAAQMPPGSLGPSAKDLWHTFREEYREGSRVLDSEVINNVLRKKPEAVVKGLRTITDARNLREMVLGYAERYGNPQQKVAAVVAWNRVRNAVILTKLGEAGPYGLQKALDKMGKGVLAEVFGGDAEGRALLDATMQLGEQMNYIATAQRGPGGGRFYALTSLLNAIPHRTWSKILANPESRILYLRGIAGYLQESKSPLKQKLGYGLSTISPNMAKMIGLVGRAWMLADESDDNSIPPEQTGPPAEPVPSSPPPSPGAPAKPTPDYMRGATQ